MNTLPNRPARALQLGPSMKRWITLAGIWFGCAIAWMVLGLSLVERTGESSTALDLTNQF